jgi:hypothetical protein
MNAIHPNARSHGFGDYQTTLRVNHRRAVIGVGHTPDEARRNALAIIEESNPDLAGFCAVMKAMNLPVERVSSARSAV